MPMVLGFVSSRPESALVPVSGLLFAVLSVFMASFPFLAERNGKTQSCRYYQDPSLDPLTAAVDPVSGRRRRPRQRR